MSEWSGNENNSLINLTRSYRFSPIGICRLNNYITCCTFFVMAAVKALSVRTQQKDFFLDKDGYKKI